MQQLHELSLDGMNERAQTYPSVDFESIGPPNLEPDGSFSMMTHEVYALTMRPGHQQELMTYDDFHERTKSYPKGFGRTSHYNDWDVAWYLYPGLGDKSPEHMFKLFRWQIGEDGKPRVTITNPYSVYRVDYLGTPEEVAGVQFADARSGMRYNMITGELSISGFDDYELVGCAPVVVKGEYGAPRQYESDKTRKEEYVSSLSVDEVIKALRCENHPDVEIIKEDIGMCLVVCNRTMPNFHRYGEAHRQVAYTVIRDALKSRGHEFNNANEFVDMVEKEVKPSPFLLVRYQKKGVQDDGMLLALVRITQQRLPQERYSYSLEITQFRPGELPESLSKYAIPKPR